MSALVLPSDAGVAALCNAIYAYPGFPRIGFDHLEAPDQDDGVCWGLKKLGDIDCLVLRGSVTPQDWLRDFAALANPFAHIALGPVHPGFLAGMEAAWAAMKPRLGRKVIVAGHSLGAGRAAILTGLMVLDGRAPLTRLTFGEPRPGFPQLAKLIDRVPARSYRNGNGVAYDLITDVPIAIGIEDYVHPCHLSDVCEEPGPNWTRRWGVFAWHAMPLYLAALERQEGLPPSGPVDAVLTPEDGVPLPIH
jgi:hypothetical protein